MPVSEARLREIVSELSPSCGVHSALAMSDHETVTCFIDLTVAEWRALSPETIQEYGGD